MRSATEQVAKRAVAQAVEHRQQQKPQQEEEEERTGAAVSPATALTFVAERTAVVVAAARLRLQEHRTTFPAPLWVPRHSEQRFLHRHWRLTRKLQEQNPKAKQRCGEFLAQRAQQELQGAQRAQQDQSG